jgi:hypothetical protein
MNFILGWVNFLLLMNILLLRSNSVWFHLLRLVRLPLRVEWCIINTTTNHLNMTILLIIMIKTRLSLWHDLRWKRSSTITWFWTCSIVTTLYLLLLLWWWYKVIDLILHAWSVHLVLLKLILRLVELSSRSLEFKVRLIALLLNISWLLLAFTHILRSILYFIWV